MSMLAEPRRKLKWSVDPRNSTWSKDESKFGQKILERMGWSKGKGLGKSEQGATEHIKVKVKNNNLGLGTAVNHEDNWIAHQDDFNQLLAELNSCHGQNNSEEATQEQTQGFSLEEKSKTSRKRVHYMKFTKGKDLSSRSETDLACIFGKRSKQTKDQDEEDSGSDSQEEKEQDSNGRNTPSNPELELNTVTSTLTMQEYFAQRMAQLKKGQSAASSPADTSNPPSPSATPTEESPNTSDMEHSKKKRRKKRKGDRQADEEKVKDTEEPHLTDEVVDTEQADSEGKKKKKKKKRAAREEDTAKERDFPIATDNAAGDAAALSTKKRKRKDKETPTQPPTVTADEHDGPEKAMDAEVSHKKKNKKKRQQLDELAEVEVVEKKPKKDKKKKKNDH